MTINIFPNLPPTPVLISESLRCSVAVDAASIQAAINPGTPLDGVTSAQCTSMLSLFGKSPMNAGETSASPSDSNVSLWWNVPALLGTAAVAMGLLTLLRSPKSAVAPVEPLVAGALTQGSSLYLDEAPSFEAIETMRPIQGENFEIVMSKTGEVYAVEQGIGSSSSEPVRLSDGMILRQGDHAFVFRTEGGPHFEVETAHTFWEDGTAIKLDTLSEGRGFLKKLYASARNPEGSFLDYRPEISAEEGYRSESLRDTQMDVLKAAEEINYSVEKKVDKARATLRDFSPVQNSPELAELRSELRSFANQGKTLTDITLGDLGPAYDPAKTLVDSAGPATVKGKPLPPSIKPAVEPKVMEEIVPKLRVR